MCVFACIAKLYIQGCKSVLSDWVTNIIHCCLQSLDTMCSSVVCVLYNVF